MLVPVIAFEMYFPSQPAADVVTVIFLLRACLSLAARWPDIRPAFFNGLMRPMYAFVLCILVSLVAAVTVLHTGKVPIYQDGRAFVYLLWVLPFLAFAPSENPERWFAANLLVLAAIVSAIAVGQGAFGITIVDTGRVAQLETLGRYNADVTRVQIPGFVFVTLAVFYCVAQLVRRDARASRLVFVILLGLFALALIFNFGRALWLWSAIGIVLTGMAMGMRATTKLVLSGGIVAGFFGAVIVWTSPQLADAVVDRLVSTAKEGGGGTSYGWREVENSNARKVLMNSALMGVGIGGDYRPPVLGMSTFEKHTRYIHNGHLYLLLKVSIFGYIAFLALFAMMLRQAARFRHDPILGPMSCAAVAWLVTFAGLNLTQPEIMTAQGLTMVTLVLAFLVSPQVQAVASSDVGPRATHRAGRNVAWSLGQVPRN